MMYDLKILVPVSLSSSSDQAIQKAIAIAKGKDAMITCLHVIEKPGFLSGLKHIRPEDRVEKREIEVLFSSKVHKAFEAHSEIPFELIITGGKVYKLVLEKAMELKADIIVMGRSDNSQTNQYYLGSNTLRVVLASGVPVFSVRKAGYTSPAHMLFPLDQNQQISPQIAKAIELAELTGVRVTIAQFICPGYRSGQPAYRMRQEKLRGIFQAAGIRTHTVITTAEQAMPEEILSLAKDLGTDLIFLMNREDSDISHAYFGSAAHHILRYAEATVLSVNPSVFSVHSPGRISEQKSGSEGGKVSNIDQCVMN